MSAIVTETKTGIATETEIGTGIESGKADVSRRIVIATGSAVIEMASVRPADREGAAVIAASRGSRNSSRTTAATIGIGRVRRPVGGRNPGGLHAARAPAVRANHSRLPQVETGEEADASCDIGADGKTRRREPREKIGAEACVDSLGAADCATED